MSRLYALSLKSNNLFGTIPSQICQLESLQILVLSFNNLHGTIPPCVNNLTSMVQKGTFLEQNKRHYFHFIDNSYIDHLLIEWQGKVNEFSSILGLLKDIDLSSNNVTGQIPNEITNLHGLLVLDLSNNSLVGGIPQNIGHMTELLTLNLSRNMFSGEMPSSMSDMHSLNDLDVSFNNLSGRVPTSTQLQSFEPTRFTGNAGLCGLPTTKKRPEDEGVPHDVKSGRDGYSTDELQRWFYVGGATGFVTGFWIVCSVLLLNRQGRREFFHFHDSVKDWVYVTVAVFIAKWRGLRVHSVLQLSDNSFYGTIPKEFGNLNNLEYLFLDSLGSCRVENLDWLSSLSSLYWLTIDGTSLAKANNRVNVIIGLQNLSTLSLVGCDLSHIMHPYSSSVNSYSSINYLYLQENNLNSPMYSWLCPLFGKKLEYLLISGNTFDGNLSDFLNTLSTSSTTLTAMDASSNQFTGSVSDEIQNISFLKMLNLSLNQLNGTISDKLWQLPNLQTLDLSFNNISGKLSKSLSKHDLDFIYLSFNCFYGPIPAFPASIRFLDLSRNKLHGGLSFLCQLYEYLEFLDLSRNTITGKLPDCFRNLTYLKVLNLGHNILSGRIPPSIGYLVQLETLCLYNNSFSGELPLNLKNCTKLRLVDLGANILYGNIPVWIGKNMSRLYALSLKSNNLFGTIPSQICRLESLQILDLSFNNLHGTIPPCVNNLTSMVQKGFFLEQNKHHYSVFINSRGDICGYHGNFDLKSEADSSSGRVSEKRTGGRCFVAMDSYQRFINGKDLLGTGGFLDIMLGLISVACPNITREPSFFKLLLIVIEATKTKTKPPKLETPPVKLRFGGVGGSDSGGCGGGRVYCRSSPPASKQLMDASPLNLRTEYFNITRHADPCDAHGLYQLAFRMMHIYGYLLNDFGNVDALNVLLDCLLGNLGSILGKLDAQQTTPFLVSSPRKSRAGINDFDSLEFKYKWELMSSRINSILTIAGLLLVQPTLCSDGTVSENNTRCDKEVVPIKKQFDDCTAFFLRIDEADAVTLLKRIRKFSMAQDIGARAAVHIFNKISFDIAKGVGAQI
ncbi:leucine-rich repeat-containing protein, partial [Tanacetum coccineum]